MLFVGVDFHQRMSCICILDENGKAIKEQKVIGCWAAVIKELEPIQERIAVCYEASCGYGHLYDQLSRIAQRVVVAHPGQVRLIFRSKRKNDRVDAKKLATLLFLDQVPAVYVPKTGVREWRSMIEFRQRLMGKQTQAKNGLRAVLRGQGVVLPVGKKLWTAQGRAWMAALELPECTALQRDMLSDQLDSLRSQIQRVTRALDLRAKTHPGVHLLRTIPGVGLRTAEAVVAYIDQPRRFSRVKQVGSYFGLVPCEDTSVKHRLGHITADGPATVRKLLTEAAWQMIRRCPQVRARFERIQHGNRDRRKIAIVAIAHYLVRVMEAMLRTGEAWRSEAPATATAA